MVQQGHGQRPSLPGSVLVRWQESQQCQRRRRRASSPVCEQQSFVSVAVTRARVFDASGDPCSTTKICVRADAILHESGIHWLDDTTAYPMIAEAEDLRPLTLRRRFSCDAPGLSPSFACFVSLLLFIRPAFSSFVTVAALVISFLFNFSSIS